MSDFSDRDLRTAFESHRGEASGENHLEAETLWSLAAGEYRPEDAARLVDHLSICPACAEDYRLTRQLFSESRSEPAAPGVEPRDGAQVLGFPTGPDDESAMSKKSAPSTWRPWLAAAAALVVAAGLWLSLVRSPDSPPVYRQGEEEKRIETSLVDGATVDRAAVLLSWTAIEGARYDLLVTTEDLSVLLEARSLEEASYRVAPDRLQGLAAGTRLIWQVEALLPDGSRLSSSAFEIVIGEKTGEKG